MSFEKFNQKETVSEVLKTPEIEFKEEKGITLLSLLLKGYNSEWGAEESKNEVTEKVSDYFKKNSLNEESEEFLQKIKALENGGVDQETLYNIALIYNKPERKEDLLEFIQKHKDDLSDPEKTTDELIKILNRVDKSLPENIRKTIEESTSNDIKQREENYDNTKKQIESLIDFFKPKTETTKIDKVTITPTDFLDKKESGSAFQFGDEIIIKSHIENKEALEHEFLHGVINPIVNKLSKKLTEEQKNNISKMGSYSLRIEQNYGDDYEALLCEEFIRTYNELIQKVETPTTVKDFQEKINKLDEVEFDALLSKKEGFKKLCEKLDISTLQDLKSKSQQFYNNFTENKLREVIFLFYQKYIQERELNEKISFEDFVLNNFEKEI